MTEKKTKESEKNGMGFLRQTNTKRKPEQRGNPIETLRTNILFSLPAGAEAKCIGFASACDGDGKSTVLCKTAESFAASGKKVLVIECDLGHPSIAAQYGIEPCPGLTNLLVGESKVKGTIRRIEHIGMDLIPAGTPSPNPIELLRAEQFAVLLDELKKYYDYIFLEMPSGASMKEDVVLADRMDGVLVVVRHNKTLYQKVDELILNLRAAQAKLLGIVYNTPEQER